MLGTFSRPSQGCVCVLYSLFSVLKILRGWLDVEGHLDLYVVSSSTGNVVLMEDLFTHVFTHPTNI